MASEEQIRELAYSIWEKEDRPEGKDAEHYFRAKKSLEEQEAVPLTAIEPTLTESTLQPPPAPKPFERRTGKPRSKKV